jgi:hypothetical protein
MPRFLYWVNTKSKTVFVVTFFQCNAKFNGISVLPARNVTIPKGGGCVKKRVNFNMLIGKKACYALVDKMFFK